MGRAGGRGRQAGPWSDADSRGFAGARARVARPLQGSAGARAGREHRADSGRQARLQVGARDGGEERRPGDGPVSVGPVEDKLAIMELIAAYPQVVDERDFDRLDELFTADARI